MTSKVTVKNGRQVQVDAENRIIESIWYRCPVCKICLQDFDRITIHIDKHFPSETSQPEVAPLKDENDCEETETKPTTSPCTITNNHSDSQMQVKQEPNFSAKRKRQKASQSNKNRHGSSPRNLTKRKRVSRRTEIKPFVCEYCNSVFNYKKNLELHIRTHTGEKPYICKICEKAFAQLTNLNNHMRTHTGERPFACKWCDKRFAQVTNLMFHERLHTGEMPYECKSCGKKFAQIANWSSHFKSSANKCTLKEGAEK